MSGSSDEDCGVLGPFRMPAIACPETNMEAQKTPCKRTLMFAGTLVGFHICFWQGNVKGLEVT